MSVELAFETVGDGPPLVILHGLFGAGRNWAGIAKALGQSYQVFLPDARNHGASSWAETMSYPDMAGDVLALIEREKLLRPVIIGHSMGGKTAMSLALQHPRAVGALAVIDIAPVAYADQFSPYVSAMRGLDVASAANRGEVRQALAHSLGGGAPIDFLMQNLRRHDERFDWRLNLMAVATCMRDLCDFPEPLMRLRHGGPALFVAGANSDYVRPESRAGIQRMFPAARIEQLANAGHWVHADQPQALLTSLRAWLNPVDRAGAKQARPALAGR